MCGISCILALQNHSHKHADLSTLPQRTIEGVELNGHPEHDAIAHELDASLDLIKHRGPDSRGQWISSDCRAGPPHPP